MGLMVLWIMMIPPSGLCKNPENIDVSVMHYFNSDMGYKGIGEIFKKFQETNQVKVVENAFGHEEFKNIVLEMAAKGYLQDVISYWAGSRTQFLVDSGALSPMDALWKTHNLSDLIPKAIAQSATLYNGKHYLVPFGYHCVGFFYNPKLFKKAGVSQAPKTWDQLLSTCERLKAKGITPFALGAKNRWPAQFWFDYLLLRTAGPDFRQKLMDGKASYTDPKVIKSMEYWKKLMDNHYFQPGMTTEGWTDAADSVIQEGAAMTLMGTWITGYWQGQGKRDTKDFDFFKFPVMDPSIPDVVIGPIDGFVISANSKNPDRARELVQYLLTNLSVQTTWVLSQGALSPNNQIDKKIYSPVMQKALKTVAQANSFSFNYDLATPPPMAEKGLSMLLHFLVTPEKYQEHLTETQRVAHEIFRQ